MLPGTIFPCVFLAFILVLSSTNAASQPDFSAYKSHDSITSENIWIDHLPFQAGVHNLTTDLYTQQILTQREGSKPWLICIVATGVKTAYWQSTYVAKSLFFMQRLMPGEAEFALLETTNEYMREAFENRGVP